MIDEFKHLGSKPIRFIPIIEMHIQREIIRCLSDHINVRDRRRRKPANLAYDAGQPCVLRFGRRQDTYVITNRNGSLGHSTLVAQQLTNLTTTDVVT